MYASEHDSPEALHFVNNFSMFEHALDISGAAAVEDLGTISNISRQDFDERTTFRFRSDVPCLEYVSLLIENALLLRTSRSGRVYAGFERLSRLEPIADRYLRIADLSERVYVFGENDWQPPRHPNMRVVHIGQESKLASEWFVIAESSTMHVGLVAYDETGWSAPVLEARTFQGFISHDPTVISHLACVAEDYIDQTLAA